MLGVDVGADAAVALGLGHDVHGEGGLAGGLGTEDLDDAAAGQAPDAEIDFYAGIRPKFGDLTFDFGVWQYYYPGEKQFVFPAGVFWSGGTEPTQTTNGTDLYTFYEIGSTIYGSAVQNMQ